MNCVGKLTGVLVCLVGMVTAEYCITRDFTKPMPPLITAFERYFKDIDMLLNSGYKLMVSHKHNMTFNAMTVFWDGMRRGKVPYNLGILDYETEDDWDRSVIPRTTSLWGEGPGGIILYVNAHEGVSLMHYRLMQVTFETGTLGVWVYIDYADEVSKQRLSDVKKEITQMLVSHGFDLNQTPYIEGNSRRALNGDTDKYGVPSLQKMLMGKGGIETDEQPVDISFAFHIANTSDITFRIYTYDGQTVRSGDRYQLLWNELIMEHEHTFNATVEIVSPSFIPPNTSTAGHLRLLTPRNIRSRHDFQLRQIGGDNHVVAGAFCNTVHTFRRS